MDFRCNLAFLVGALACAPQAVARDLQASTVYIEVGYEKNGVFNRVALGSGFIVSSSGWVVTAKHVLEESVPEGEKKVFFGAVGSSAAQKYALGEVAGPVTSADVALLRFPPDLRIPWPALKIVANHVMVIGERVSVAGFPLNSGFSLKNGEVTSLVGNFGAVQINAGLAPGMSGGPVVLATTGCVVGLVSGASFPTFDYFTPITYARSLIETTPAEFVSDSSSGGGPNAAHNVFNRAYQLDETKDDHGAAVSSNYFERTYKADPNAQILSAKYLETSAASVSDKGLNIAEDRLSATFRFKLQSGPFYDQWRGWWHGQIILTEQSVASSDVTSALICD